MARPSTRQQLIDYCLRKLGEPVLEVNVDEDQLEDKVDDAFQYFNEYHMDGVSRMYLPYTVTQTDFDNKYIPINDSVVTVLRLFPVDSGWLSGSDMFSIKYQMMFNNITDIQNIWGDLAFYEQTQQQLSLLDMSLNGTPQVDFSRRQNRLYVYGDDLEVGKVILLEVLMGIDANGVGTSSSIYNDIFIKEYTTVLIKEQWGQNLIKFEGMQLPGGVTLNGNQILEAAKTEKEALLQRLRLEFEEPLDFFVG